jgi:hypothetical protein
MGCTIIFCTLLDILKDLEMAGENGWEEVVAQKKRKEGRMKKKLTVGVTTPNSVSSDRLTSFGPCFAHLAIREQQYTLVRFRVYSFL